jgi:hypothetical protein
MFSRQPLFRIQALEQYAQRREKAVLPRLVTPPVLLCFWLLLGLLLLSTVLAWQVQVPLYQGAPGILLNAAPSRQPAPDDWQALLFVPATPAPELPVGASLTVQMLLTGESFAGTIAAVRPEALSPAQARAQYHLAGDVALLMTQPSVAVQVRVGPTLPPDAIPGISLRAQVPIGQHPLLALLPHLLRGFLGG